MYAAPLIEGLGLAEVENNPRGKHMRAKSLSRRPAPVGLSGRVGREGILSRLVPRQKPPDVIDLERLGQVVVHARGEA